MSADSLQKHCFRASIFDEPKDDSEIVSGVASPGVFEFSPQLMGAQCGVECVFCQEFQSSLQIVGNLRVLSHHALCGADKSR